MSTRSIGFRPDINGLRAIAVSSVILFHAKAPLITGGYAGVDVFFVISGYLMTSIIVGRLEGSTFSFRRFYADRARRILPALMSAVATLTIFGYFFIEPSSYRFLFKHALASLLFVSNVVYNREAGYFGAPSESKWLLHTWSLSVEWQFYIIYPVILWGISTFNYVRQQLLVVLWLLGAVSFSISAVVSAYNPDAGFFFFPARGWEMLAGGIVYAHGRPSWLTSRWVRPTQMLGLALIAVTFFAFDRASPWPSWRAIIPVVGTSLVILAHDVDAKWASNSIADFTGRWSYSAYIWHWPIIVGINSFQPTHAVLVTCLLVAVLVAAAYSFDWLRQRFDRVLTAGRSFRFAAVYVGLFVTCVVGYASDGMIWRVEDPALVRRYEAAFGDFEYPYPCGSFARGGNLSICKVGDLDRPSTLVLGDSHAEMLFPGFLQLTRSRPEIGSISFATRGGCPLLPGASRYVSGYRCSAFLQQALALAETGRFQHVILASFWMENVFPTTQSRALDPLCFREGHSCRPEPNVQAFNIKLDDLFAKFALRISELVRRGIHVTIVAPFPLPPGDLPHELERRAFLRVSNADLLEIDRERLSRANRTAMARLLTLVEQSGARLIDPFTFLCEAKICPLVDSNGQPLFRDSNHLRASFVRSEKFGLLDKLVGEGR